mgnify:CR=1 FL=1
MLNLIKHLLPNGRAWSLTINKALRRFFNGLTGVSSDYKDFNDKVLLDIFPETTRQLSEWEAQFALPNVGLTESARRARLAGAWQSQGGQTVGYIQKTLQDAGFDVYVHEFSPTFPPAGANYCPGIYVPTIVLDPTSTDPVPPLGYALPNGTVQTTQTLTCLAGEDHMEAGEELAEAGEFEGYEEEKTPHQIPATVAEWPYFLYIGAEIFGDLAPIPSDRRAEFEALALQIKPAQHWLGMLVEYT